MKKISIILSAALLAATFALASCSNVTELNGTEWDTYKAGASGQTLAAANAAAVAETAAEAEKVSITYAGADFADFKDVKNHKSAITSTWKNEFTWDLNATAGTAATYTVTSSTGIIWTASVKAGDKTAKFSTTSVLYTIDHLYNSSATEVKKGGTITLTVTKA